MTFLIYSLSLSATLITFMGYQVIKITFRKAGKT